MKILVHDYSGHPFQVGLSRELARRGHAVVHCYDANFVTPHGDLAVRTSDSSGLSIVPLTTGASLAKHALVRRWRQERAYGKVIARFIKDESPDVVLSANTPLGAQAFAVAAARESRARFVFWVQDLYGLGMDRAIRARVRLLGGLIGAHFIRSERRLLSGSDAVIAISDDFRPFILDSDVAEHRLTVIENWGPVNDFKIDEKHLAWRDQHGLAGKFVFLYSGTLGLKHNPAIIASLAREFARDTTVMIVVASEGGGADWLRGLALPNVLVLGFQPYAELSPMLRAADVLVAILRSEASVFAVPSKVLTYMCAGRPILAAIPLENLAARIIVESGCGEVVRPEESIAFLKSARILFEEPQVRRCLGDAGRRHAERRFQIEEIAKRFEDVLSQSTRTGEGTS